MAWVATREGGDSSTEEECAMHVLYMVSRGTADPTGASIPLHLAANGTLEVGDEASIVLAGDATAYLADNAWERAEGVGLPPMRELVTKLRDHEVPVYV
jgi:predicted peroxiredoxin